MTAFATDDGYRTLRGAPYADRRSRAGGGPLRHLGRPRASSGWHNASGFWAHVGDIHGRVTDRDAPPAVNVEVVGRLVKQFRKALRAYIAYVGADVSKAPPDRATAIELLDEVRHRSELLARARRAATAPSEEWESYSQRVLAAVEQEAAARGFSQSPDPLLMQRLREEGPTALLPGCQTDRPHWVYDLVPEQALRVAAVNLVGMVALLDGAEVHPTVLGLDEVKREAWRLRRRALTGLRDYRESATLIVEAIETADFDPRWIKAKRVGQRGSVFVKRSRLTERQHEPIGAELDLDNITEADVVQGELADSHLLSALLTIVCNDPGYIREMVVDNGETVSIRFYRRHGRGQYSAEWVTVAKSLVRRQGQLLLAKSPWVGLIEKAYAAWDGAGQGSYGKISGGSAAEALKHLLGEEASQQRSPDVASLAGQVFELFALASNDPCITAVTSRTGVRVPNSDFGGTSIHPGRTYEVLTASGATVTLRDPCDADDRTVVVAHTVFDRYFETIAYVAG